jgi:predicted short-subunit dehydrogenase-like oxidoreductase (DUF2520 family)
VADRPTMGFIGAGRAAGVLGEALAQAGYDVVAVASRSPASAEAVAARIRDAGGDGSSPAAAQAVADAAELVLITTTDAAIAEIAGSLRWRAGQSVVHCSGALSIEPLAAARAGGAATGSWHPFQTLTARTSLSGVTFGIEAEGHLYDVLADMAVAVGGTPLPVPAEARALYHAASVLSCGYLTTLLREAQRLWESAGLPREAAAPAIGALAEATLTNLRALGPEATLTGPTSRGDAGTVRLHLEAVASVAPDLLPLYVAISRRSAVLAHEAGKATPPLSEWDELFARYVSTSD